MIDKISNFPPILKFAIMLATDAVLIPLVLWIALALRFGETDISLDRYALGFATLEFATLSIFYYLGIYRTVVSSAGWDTFNLVAKGSILSAGILLVITLMAPDLNFPRSVFLIYGAILFIFVGGSRVLARKILRGGWRSEPGIPLAIYGAGASGRQLVRMFREGPDYAPVIFLDDNKELRGRKIEGLSVYNPASKKLGTILQKHKVEQILLCMPSARRSERLKAIDLLSPFSYPVRTVPGVQEIISGDADLTQIRSVKIEDLLGRSRVAPNEKLLERCIYDQTVLITGAGGSIGSELCLQVLSLKPRQMLLYEISEYNLYRIEQELREKAVSQGWGCEITAILGSVTNKERVKQVFSTHKISTVYHAAAYKHVPLVEANPVEGLRNNVLGTLNIVEQAAEHRIKHFVSVSTDKAVRPTNVMGASKRLGELILQAFQEKTPDTVFSMVRFGNVIGSSGSVVPLFRRQISEMGPVTVTHREVTRFFMTIPEAVQLIIQAGAMAQGGDVFVLDMGEPVRIIDLAERMIHLSGLEVKNIDNPDGDVEIEIVGLRPGEKMYEELLIGQDAKATEHPKIHRANDEMIPWKTLRKHLEVLEVAMTDYNIPEIYNLLRQLTGAKI